MTTRTNSKSGFSILGILIVLTIISVLSFISFSKLKSETVETETGIHSVEDAAQEIVDGLNEQQEKAEQEMADGLDAVLGGN